MKQKIVKILLDIITYFAFWVSLLLLLYSPLFIVFKNIPALLEGENAFEELMGNVLFFILSLGNVIHLFRPILNRKQVFDSDTDNHTKR